MGGVGYCKTARLVRLTVYCKTVRLTQRKKNLVREITYDLKLSVSNGPDGAVIQTVMPHRLQ